MPEYRIWGTTWYDRREERRALQNRQVPDFIVRFASCCFSRRGGGADGEHVPNFQNRKPGDIGRARRKYYLANATHESSAPCWLTRDKEEGKRKRVSNGKDKYDTCMPCSVLGSVGRAEGISEETSCFALLRLFQLHCIPSGVRRLVQVKLGEQPD